MNIKLVQYFGASLFFNHYSYDPDEAEFRNDAFAESPSKICVKHDV